MKFSIEISKEQEFEICNRKYLIVLLTEAGKAFIETAYSFEEVADLVDNAKSGKSALLSVTVFSKLET